MKKRPILTVMTIAGTFAIAGCNGPTQSGIEARANARDRINNYNAQFTYDQAMHEYETGQFDRAMSNIEAAIEEVPDVPSFHVLRGRIFLETHRLEAASASFMHAIELDPENAQAHYFAGIVFQRWSDDEKACKHYGHAFEYQPDQVQYLLATGESLIALGEYDRARELVEAKLAYFEHNAALQQLLGQISLLEGDPRAAAQLYGQARLLDPENNLLLEELAWVQYDAELFGQCHETVKLLQSRLDNPRTDLMHLEARCLTMLGRSVDAHTLYMDLSRRSPANPSVWIEFGTLAWKLGDYRRVAHCSVRTIALAPDRFEGFMLKGLYERQRGRIEDATTLLRQAADLSKETVMPHLLLGRTLEESGQNQEAVAVYTEAMKLDPTSQDAQALFAALNESMVVTAEEE